MRHCGRLGCPGLLAVSFILLGAAFATAQGNGRIVASLRISQDQPALGYQTITFQGRSTADVLYYLPTDRDVSVGRASGVLMRIERLHDDVHSCRVQVDADGDGDFVQETAQVLVPESSFTVSIERTWPNGRHARLPYAITYKREVGAANQVKESFEWSARYRSEGRLRAGKCDSLLVLWDIDADGRFDDDSSLGTNLSIDQDGDGRIWGKTEYRTAAQLVEYCGNTFVVDEVAPDGSVVAFAPTALRVPRLGDEVPDFDMTTTDGRVLRLRDLRGRVHLLDFWATWCAPCVEKLPLVRQLGQDYATELTIIGINVDEAPRVPMAKEIIRAKQLPWPHVVRGLGDADPVWKTLGGFEGRMLSVPFYVLLSETGRIVYAGWGGTDLGELRSQLDALLKSSRRD